MMGLEGPYVTAIIARMPDAEFNLAAYGIAFAIAWIVEAPILMLLTAGNALVRDRQSFLALRRYGYVLDMMLTLALVVIALPPVFRAMVNLVGLPSEVTRLANFATAVVIPWPAAIGYRRFYQGLLVRHGLTRRVAYGTVVRLISMSGVAAALAWWSPFTGATIGALSLTIGVVCEAAASRWMSWQVVTTLLQTPPAPGTSPLTTQAITQFYYPLALTSVLSLITLPVITFFMGHSRNAIESLAVLPVITAFVFLFRSGAYAYQEVAVALTGLHHEHEAEVRRVARLLGGIASAALAVVALTPLANVWFESVSGLTPGLARFALWPVRILMLLPALEYLLQSQRACLILSRRSRSVTAGTGVEAVGISVALAVSVGWLDLPGAIAAAVALMTGRIGVNLFLHRAMRT